MRKCWIVLWVLWVACATPAPPAPATEATPAWSELRDVSTVELVTVDPDGDERVTTVWLAVVDDMGAIRTGNSRWFANLQRNPELRFRAEGTEYPLRVEFVTDQTQAAAMDAVFREKYGTLDAIISFLRGDGTNRMWLRPR